MQRKKAILDSWLKKLQGRLGFNQFKLYLDLSLPLDRFIRCIVHSDLSALIIKGNPPSEDLSMAWMKVYSEYLDLNYLNDEVYIINIDRDIALLDLYVIQVRGCINFLRVVYNDDLVRILRENGHHNKFTSQVPGEYEPILKSIESKLAMKELSLEGKHKEKKAYLDSIKDDEITESYFDRWLIRLAKFQGTNTGIIRSKDITTKEFVMLIKSYTEFASAHNKAIEDAKEGKNR